MPGPLDGVKIVELSIAFTAPMAVSLLADQGAEVAKIEPPGLGDIMRYIGVNVNGMGASFHLANRGKRSIAIDLTKPGAQDVLHGLVRDADVFVSNYRPGVAERLGAGYDALRSLREDLIYVSISGFGDDGPYSGYPAYDNVVQAYSGLAQLQADPETGEPRVVQGQTAADKLTAITASQAITAALFARERGAGGQHVKLAMLDAVVGWIWMDGAGNETLLDSDGSSPSAFSAGLKFWRYTDGWGTATPVSDKDFFGMCEAFEVDGADDPRVATIMDRRQNHEYMGLMMERIGEAATRLSTAEATGRMRERQVPCGVALSVDQLHEDPQVQWNELLVESKHPVAGRLRQPRPAARFTGTPAQIAGDGPLLGQHTDELLSEMGLGDSIARLREDGVVS
jgi:crotonobetainyl-CoA:carnitine CoA-transferase CaiB-like acyl-CoA transferase